jgi:hypothetical protein
LKLPQSNSPLLFGGLLAGLGGSSFWESSMCSMVKALPQNSRLQQAAFGLENKRSAAGGAFLLGNIVHILSPLQSLFCCSQAAMNPYKTNCIISGGIIEALFLIRRLFLCL